MQLNKKWQTLSDASGNGSNMRTIFTSIPVTMMLIEQKSLIEMSDNLLQQ